MAKVRNIGSNQTLIDRDDGTQILVSYATPVAAFLPGQGYLRTEQKHSRTTSKHINQWIRRKDAPTRPQEFFDALL